MSQQKGRRDFSDIDHLDRATESFMKGQRKALEGYRPPRARRKQRRLELDFHRITKIAAIAAVFAVIVGTVIFAGIRFGDNGRALLQPEQPAVTDSTEPSAETTTALPAETLTEPETSLPTTASAKATTAPQPPDSSSRSTEPSVSSSTATASITASAEQQAAPAASSSRTTATTTRTTTTTTRTTTTTTSTSTTAKRTTTRTTTSTTRTTTSTTRTTTTSTSTSTSTTAAPKAIISISSITVGGWEDYNNHEGVIHYLTITVQNTGNATLSGSQKLTVGCDGCGGIIHASCTSGSTASSISYNGNTLYVPYNGRLAPGGTDTVVMRVITRSLFFDCSY